MSDPFSSSCSCGCTRRAFLAGAGGAGAALALSGLEAVAADSAQTKPADRQPASVHVVFAYVPSKRIADDPDGWWSWPGNDFDAEGRQKQYTASLREIEKKYALKLAIDEAPITSAEEAQAKAAEVVDAKADGLLVILMHNFTRKVADVLVASAEKAGIPVVYYIPLGVTHGSVASYRRPGLYFIQSLENLEAVEYGLRMIHARKRMAQSRLLSITEAPAVREGVEQFLGTTVRVLPFKLYAEAFAKTDVDDRAKAFIAAITANATERRKITQESLENAARAHLALTGLLAEHGADGLTMNCLRRGMLKPCMSFAMLNGQLIPATCENDFPAMYGQMIGQLLTGRAGFQHNPCFDTERNHFYGSHCTCSPKLYGPDGPELPYLLRRFAHTNEGSCAIQVFFKEGDPVTSIHYYGGKPPALDIYAGRVVKSHPMPPAGGCTTNVEFEITDRDDACSVAGHHNILFVGDFARKFRLFANLFKMKLRSTPNRGPAL